MVDVVHHGQNTPGLGIGAAAAEVEQVLDHPQEVLAADEHLVFRRVQVELAVDPEATHAPEAIAVVIEELLDEELLGLLDLRRVAGTQLAVNLQHRLLVGRLGIELLEFLLRDGVEDQHVAGILDHPDFLEAAGDDGLRGLADLPAHVDQFLAGARVDDRLGGPMLGLDVLDLDLADLVEEAQQALGLGHALVEASEEGGCREFRALVDAHRQHVLLGHLEFDPGASFGDDTGRVKRPIALARQDREVHAGRSVQLAHDDAFGSVHDELATAHHDRELAQVNLLLGELRLALTLQTHPHPERAAVGQAEFAALIGGVARLFERVVDVLQGHRLVVTLDREDLVQERFQPLQFIAVLGDLAELKESLVRLGLDLAEVADRHGIAALRVVTDSGADVGRSHRCHRSPRDGGADTAQFELRS